MYKGEAAVAKRKGNLFLLPGKLTARNLLEVEVRKFRFLVF